MFMGDMGSLYVFPELQERSVQSALISSSTPFILISSCKTKPRYSILNCVTYPQPCYNSSFIWPEQNEASLEFVMLQLHRVAELEVYV